MDEVSLPPAPRRIRLAAAVVRRLPAGRYRLMNQLCRRPTPPFLSSTDSGDGGFVFHCDLRDSIAREVCFTGRYEPQETAIVKALLPPGGTFVDVGANWGYFTLLAAHRVGPAGRVISLEPDPRIFRKLRQNVTLNHLGQVTALQVAAAETRAVMRMAGYDETGDNFGLSRLVASSDGGSSSDEFDVPTMSLDELFDELAVKTVDLLKMDIEGAEGFALRGLASSLNAGRIHRLLLEVHPAQLAQHGLEAAEILGLLSTAGYKPWRIDHDARTTRRVAYCKNPEAEQLLSPLDVQAPLDGWPHILWVAPGMKLFE